MPSINKTETIKLSQYEGNECQKRVDVNEDNLKIDNKFKLVDSQISENKKNISKNTDDISQLSNQNLLINGDFQVWQRGIDFNCDENTKYTADRWVLGGDTYPTAKKTEKGIAITTTNAGTWTNFFYRLEDNFFDRLVGEKLTITFKTSSPTNDINLVWCNGRTIDDKEVFHVQDSHFASETIDTFSATFEIKQKSAKSEIGIQLKSDKAGITTELMWERF